MLISGKKFLTKTTAILLFLLCIPFSSAQENIHQNNSNNIDKNTWQNASYAIEPDESNNKRTREAGSYTFFFIRTLLVLAVFVVGGYFILRYIRKKNPGMGTDSDLIQVLANHSFNMTSSIKVIQIGSDFYSIGVTAENINLLSSITDKETIDNLKLENSNKEKPRSIFSDFLGNYLKVKNRHPLEITRNITQSIKNKIIKG